VPEQLCFWSRRGVGRLAFLERVLDRFERSSWETRLDSGWERHDVEVVRSRWAQLRVTTAGEELSRGRLFLRCRVEARWSVLARLSFWGLVLAEALLVHNLAGRQPWLWLLLPLLPLLAWFFDDEKNHHRVRVARAIEQTAEGLELERYVPGREPRSA
jgi:hypothetical protein